LREALDKAGLDTKGKKAALLARLQAAQGPDAGSGVETLCDLELTSVNPDGWMPALYMLEHFAELRVPPLRVRAMCDSPASTGGDASACDSDGSESSVGSSSSEGSQRPDDHQMAL
jgi:hypothetical protein